MKLSSGLSKKQKYITQPGFTIVELLIVIVVIAILAAISIVSYTGIQNRANDSSMRSAAAQVEKSMQLWANATSNKIMPGGSASSSAPTSEGCANGIANGFIGPGFYACSVEEHLAKTGFLPSGFTSKLPINTYYGSSSGRFSLMLYRCNASDEGTYVLLWTLRSPTAKDAQTIADAKSECPDFVGVNVDTYGMKAAKRVNL